MADAGGWYLVNKGYDCLMHEASLLLGVDQKVEKLQRDLICLRGILEYAEEGLLKKGYNANKVQQCEWVSQVRDVVYDIEDLLDIYSLKVYEKREQRQGFLAYIKKCFCMCEEEADLYNIGKVIETLNGKIADVYSKHQNSGISHASRDGREGSCSNFSKLRQLRRAPAIIMPQEHVIGFEDDANLLKSKLLDKSSHRLVVSIYGMGGIGKTTLAGKLYNTNEVQNEFNCHGWVTISQDYNIRDLFQAIIRSFRTSLEMKELDKLKLMVEEDLELYLHQHLFGKKYLLVIDDVWEKEVWQSLRRAFPDEKNGSRIIITTRNKDVAECTDERTYAHKLRFLNFKESWELFREKAFLSIDETDREEKEEIGKEMVLKCSGLPLAIMVLGGLLSKKRVGEWRRVHYHLWQKLEKDSILIEHLLALSFNDLRHELRLCFLYLCAYPEDCKINTSRLILLLIAEGFIPKDEGQMEEVAEEYLLELVDRSLIQAKTTRKGKISIYCQVHDLLRDLAIRKAKEMNFIEVYNEFSCSNCSSCRRHAIHSSIDRYFCNHQLNSQTRSLIFYNKYQVAVDLTKISLTVIFERFRLLRVLNLDLGQIKTVTTLPEGLGELIHLRYLLIGLHLEYIPASIRKLKNLQTLFMFNQSPHWLSLDLRNITSLRHITLNFEGDLMISDVKCLQTLKFISWENWCKIETEKLIELRELGIDNFPNHLSNNISFYSFASLCNLRVLAIRVGSFLESSLEKLYHCHNLIELRLDGVLKKFPKDVHELLPNLEHLILAGSELEQDPMPLLGKLPNLRFLYLGSRSHLGEKMVCKLNDFLRLECLDLYYCDDVKELFVEEGAMLKLIYLVTKLHGEKLSIPERLQPMVKHERDDTMQADFSDRGVVNKYLEERPLMY